MRIKSLNAFRFVLAVLILLSHAGMIANVGDQDLIRLYGDFFRNGTMVTTIFFVLSGFLTGIGYREKFQTLTWKGYLHYLKRRFFKIYPLYALTMLYVFFYRYAQSGWNPEFAQNNYLDLIMALTFTQTIFFKHWAALNAVGWFVSSLFIIYLFVPLIIWLFNKIKKSILVYSLVNVGVFVFVFSLTHLIIHFSLSETTTLQSIFDIMHVFPFTNIIFVVCGIAFSYLFVELRQKINMHIVVASILEVLVIGILFTVIYLNLHYTTDSYLMCPVSVLVSFAIMFVFGFDQGIISKFFALRPMQYLGSISMEVYLLHYIPVYVMQWNDYIYAKFEPGGVKFACFMFIFLWILMAVLLGSGWKVIENGVKKIFTKKDQVIA